MVILAAAALSSGATLLCGSEAHAATAVVSWVGGSGSWMTPANWSSNNAPPADTAVYIVHNDSASRSIMFNGDYPTTPLHRFILDQTGMGQTTFTMPTGNFGALAYSINDFEFIGMNGHATFVQSGGSNVGDYYNQIQLGVNPGSAGTYTHSGGTLTMGVIECGVSGNGTLNLSGGVTKTSDVEVGIGFAINGNPQAVGVLNLSGTASLSASIEYCGNGGIGYVNQSGGAQWLDGLTIASGEGAAGTYNMSGGTLRARILVVGGGTQYRPASAFFSQTGGTVTNTESLHLGAGQLGTGGWDLSGGTLNVGGDFIVGWYGHGSFTVGPAATLSVTGGYLDIAEQAGSAGTFTSSGSFNTIADDIGVGGAGTYIQNGGAHATTRIILGDGTTATGAYFLNGGTLIAANEYIGESGPASFNQSGGVHCVSNVLTLSDQYLFDCAYNQSGGTLSATVFDNRFGTFTQTGGVATFTNGVTGQGGALNVSGSGRMYTPRIDQFTLNVGTGGLVVCTPHAGPSAPENISYVRELSITGTGKVDLANNDLVINYGVPISSETMRGYISSAHAGGSWTGNGLTSSAAGAQASAPHKTALGYADAKDLFTSFPAVWNGTVVSDTEMLVKYTYAGDANLDGTVDTLDFNALAGHFGGTGQYWSKGDFNYDGVVDTLDFNALAGNFGQTLASDDAALASSLVPEPAELAALLAFAKIATRPRLRRRKHSSAGSHTCVGAAFASLE